MTSGKISLLIDSALNHHRGRLLARGARAKRISVTNLQKRRAPGPAVAPAEVTGEYQRTGWAVVPGRKAALATLANYLLIFQAEIDSTNVEGVPSKQ